MFQMYNQYKNEFIMLMTKDMVFLDATSSKVEKDANKRQKMNESTATFGKKELGLLNCKYIFKKSAARPKCRALSSSITVGGLNFG